MPGKTEYIERFKKLYELKNGTKLSDDLALEYFENLAALTETITGHISLKKIIISENHGRK